MGINRPALINAFLWSLTLATTSSLFLDCSTTKPKLDEKGLPIPLFQLTYAGNQYLVDYEKFGEFVGRGTENYRYEIHDHLGLQRAVGEGNYPNSEWVEKDSLYGYLKTHDKLSGNYWKAHKDPAENFYIWIDAAEDMGVRHYMAAMALKESGNILPAIKTFYAALVHFSKSAGYTEDGKRLWYVAPAAMGQLEILCLKYPSLGVKYVKGKFEIINGEDTDRNNDVIKFDPGSLVGDQVGLEHSEGAPKVAAKPGPEIVALLDKPLELRKRGLDILALDYSKFGRFENLGQRGYRYVLIDTLGLAEAVGEGIYPNQALQENSQFQSLASSQQILSHPMESMDYAHPARMFFSFASAVNSDSDQGANQFFAAEALREAAIKQNNMVLAQHALKAYHAVLIHFPGTLVLAPNGSFGWYPARAAITKIKYLLKAFPQIKADFSDYFILVKNEYDLKTQNDTLTVHPGFFKKHDGRLKSTEIPGPSIVSERGTGKVQLKKYSNGHWQLFVDKQPFTIKAVTYMPSKIAESPHNGSLRNWQLTDDNHNGKSDSPYDAWLDKNGNNIQDADEVSVGDFQLMKDMGVNAIRFYHSPIGNIHYDSQAEFNKVLLRDMHHKYGIRAIMGDFIGAYTVGSGADWAKGTDYRDPVQKKSMKEVIRQWVMDNKDEDYVLMWLLGNENNMNNAYGGVNATKTLAADYPVAYAEFLNEVATMIHEIDPNHPVGIGNLETQLIEYYTDHAPAIDILGVNSYRGKEGFGDLFGYVQKIFDRPVLITEFGSDILNIQQDTILFDETSQLEYHRGAWEDIRANLASGPEVGNAIGGVAFEWVDEWWKSSKGPWDMQDFTRDSPMAFQDGWSSEEFFGIMSQGDGRSSPYLRHARMTYYYYQKEWNRHD
jgi:hypothetical protein